MLDVWPLHCSLPTGSHSHLFLISSTLHDLLPCGATCLWNEVSQLWRADARPAPNPRFMARAAQWIYLDMQSGSIWTWSPALFGHGALFGNEFSSFFLKWNPALIWTSSPPPFGHGARLHLEMEPGSIWKWNPALFGNETRLYLEMVPTALFGHGTRLHLEMKPGFIWTWNPPPIDFAETDLTKAFDHLSPVLAQHALNHFGAHNAITATLAQAWSACRVCTVHGIVAAPLHPSRGVPQGDPCSPLALGVASCPWNQLIEGLSNTLRTWCYMDDRTIAVVSRSNKALLQKALQITNHFDAQIGFTINNDKTQIWFSGESNGTMEHLGLVHEPDSPTKPIQPRDPDKVRNVVQRPSRLSWHPCKSVHV